MGNRRACRMLLSLFLLLGIVTNGVMTEACLCKEPCLGGLQGEIDAKENLPFHKRCTGNHCKRCTLEDGLTFKAAASSTPISRVKSCVSLPILAILAVIIPTTISLSVLAIHFILTEHSCLHRHTYTTSLSFVKPIRTKTALFNPGNCPFLRAYCIQIWEGWR